MLHCHYNFMRPHRALKFGGEVRTQAMQAGPTTRRLTLKEIFPRAAVLGVSEKVMFGQSTVSVMFNETQALAAQEQLMTEAPRHTLLARRAGHHQSSVSPPS
jgi:hypothetical protein